MASHDNHRMKLRVYAAGALHLGATRADLIADLLCVSRGIGHPGPREHEDAQELAHLWQELDGDPPPRD